MQGKQRILLKDNIEFFFFFLKNKNKIYIFWVFVRCYQLINYQNAKKELPICLSTILSYF